VVCNLAAPIGRRRSKLKCKPIETPDRQVVEVDRNGKRCTLRTFGQTFRVGCKGAGLVAGQVVEVKLEGRYRSGEPRFARVVRRRDLEVAA